MYGGLRRNLRLWSVIVNESSCFLAKSDTLKQENSKIYTFVYVFSSRMVLVTIREKVEKFSHEDLEKAYYEMKEWIETGNLSDGLVRGILDKEKPFVNFHSLFGVFAWEMARRHYETKNLDYAGYFGTDRN